MMFAFQGCCLSLLSSVKFHILSWKSKQLVLSAAQQPNYSSMVLCHLVTHLQVVFNKKTRERVWQLSYTASRAHGSQQGLTQLECPSCCLKLSFENYPKQSLVSSLIAVVVINMKSRNGEGIDYISFIYSAYEMKELHLLTVIFAITTTEVSSTPHLINMF